MTASVGSAGRPVLVSGGIGQSPGQLSVVRALAAAGYEVHVAASHPLSTAAASRDCARTFGVPVTTDPGYAAAVTSLVQAGDYVQVLLTSDAAMLALQWPGHELIDKATLAERARVVGLPTPEEHVHQEAEHLLAAAPSLHYPLAVKSLGAGPGQSVWRADGPDDVARSARGPGPFLTQRWLEGPQHSVCGVVWDGRLRAVVHQVRERSWPRGSGPSSYATTTTPDIAVEEAAAALLGDHQGIFQLQLIDGHLHDLNPRAYGSISLAVRAGVNLPAITVGLADGQDPGRTAPLRGRTGVRYRWLEGDLRSLGQARRAGDMSTTQVLRSLAPHRRTVHPDWSPLDPRPMLTRSRYVWGRRSEP